MKIKINLEFNKHKWLHRLLPFISCKHRVVSVEEGFEDKYGTKTIYNYCLNCGRTAMEIERACKHKVGVFGKCFYCLSRITKYDCTHTWMNEPDTDEYFCENCGEWEDKIYEIT